MIALNSLVVVLGAVDDLVVGVCVAAGTMLTSVIPLKVCLKKRPGCTSLVE